jgi:hypothetical protein
MYGSRLVVPGLPKYDAKPSLPRKRPLDPGANGYTNYHEEWLKARDSTDKFDGNLFDLRKYGF